MSDFSLESFVIILPDIDHPNHQWKFQRVEDVGCFAIANKASGYILEQYQNKTEPNWVVASKGGGWNDNCRQWKLVDKKNDSFGIINKATNHALELHPVDSWFGVDDTRVCASSLDTYAPNRRWKLIPR